MIRDSLSTFILRPPQSLWSYAARIADSSSRNAVAFSSACTTKRFPSLRCASATKIVRPSRSTVATQPQLQPALLRLSAKIFSVLHWITTSQDTGKWSENCDGFCSMRVSSRDALSKIDSGCLAAADFLFVFRDTHCERVDVPPKLRLAIPRHLQLAFAA